MSQSRPSRPTHPRRILIAGGGVAALEALLALERHARELVKVELLAPDAEFRYRPLSVAEPFGLGKAATLGLEAFAAAHGARLRRGALAAVDSARKEVRTTDDEVVPYDALLLACGARPREAVPGALTFSGSEDADALRAVLGEAEHGELGHVAFVLPRGASWPIPLYELALMSAAHLARVAPAAQPRLTVVIHERAPLELFGAVASEAVATLLRQAEIDFLSHAHPTAFEAGVLRLVPHDLRADRVVALPRLVGPAPEGLPHDAEGFVAIDRHGRVPGAADVYAAGDATDFPIKHGGLAAEQADAAAEAIAAWAGAPIEPAPFRPVLRGRLLTGGAPVYVRAALAPGPGETSRADDRPLWWPPTKIAGRLLGPALSAAAIDAPAPQLFPFLDVQVDLDEARTFAGA